MYTLKVAKIACGGCAAKINSVLKTVDEAAEIVFDRMAGIIQVKSDLSLDEIRTALDQIGYPTAVI